MKAENYLFRFRTYTRKQYFPGKCGEAMVNMGILMIVRNQVRYISWHFLKAPFISKQVKVSVAVDVVGCPPPVSNLKFFR